MDVWQWVEEKVNHLREKNHHRLANIIFDIPMAVHDRNYDQVDALFPEGLALARQLNDAWLEVYLRHWYLQSKVLGQKKAKGMAHEAVDLLNFAHQKETKECPQRICVVQDLTNCYEITDGPGYAQERINVAEETLATIDGSWGCYLCIGSELISALIDAKQYQIAENKLAELRIEMEKNNTYKPNSSFVLYKTKLLIKQNKLKAAKKLISNYSDKHDEKESKYDKKIKLALIYACQAQYKKSLKKCLSFDKVISRPSLVNEYSETIYLLAKAGKISVDVDLLEKFDQLSQKLLNNGAYRDSFDICVYFTELAIKHKFFIRAEFALATMKHILPQLRKDLGASEQLQTLDEQLQAQIQSVTPFHKENNLAALYDFEFESIDAKAFAVLKALEDWPYAERLVMLAADIYHHFGKQTQVIELLQGKIKACPDQTSFIVRLGQSLIEYEQKTQFLELFDQLVVANIPNDEQVKIFWLYVKAHRYSNQSQALLYLQRIIKLEPFDLTALTMLADIYITLENYDQAQNIYDQLARMQPDDNQHQWDLLVVATLLKDWASINSIAKTLQCAWVDNNESSAIQHKPIMLQFAFEGEITTYYANRTGPATACVTDIKPMDYPQKFNHQVVFRPIALNILDQMNDEAKPCDQEGNILLLYSVVKVTQACEYFIFDLHGAHPGESQLQALMTLFADYNITYDIARVDDYIVYLMYNDDHGDFDEDLPGIYIKLAAPAGCDLTELSQKLQAFSSQQKHPLIWPILLEAIKDYDVLEQQKETQELYDLYY